jgi:hypothetical protein
MRAAYPLLSLRGCLSTPARSLRMTYTPMSIRCCVRPSVCCLYPTGCDLRTALFGLIHERRPGSVVTLSWLPSPFRLRPGKWHATVGSSYPHCTKRGPFRRRKRPSCTQGRCDQSGWLLPGWWRAGVSAVGAVLSCRLDRCVLCLCGLRYGGDSVTLIPLTG